MNDSELIRNALLEIMDEFHYFCEDHGLVYFLVGGGLIGAVRHKGFIPWDDDLDVIMPKSDFDKLVKLNPRMSSSINFSHRSVNEKCYRACAVLTNNKVTIDTGGYKNSVSGVALDILCMYPTFDNDFLVTLHFKTVSFFRNLLIFKGGTYPKNKYKAYFILNFFQFFVSLLPKRLINVFLSLSENVGCLCNNNVANLHGAWGAKETVNKGVFFKRELYEFEGREYWSMAFIGADAWLTKIYGDYMKLPPEEQRVYRHIDKVIRASD